MPRIARVVVKNAPHHVTQRGNYKQKIFFNNKDRESYLKLIKKYSNKYKLDILAFCLMNNHVHLIVVPKKKDSMAKVFKAVNAKHALRINKRKKVTGHLWENRFFSCVLDDRHAYIATRYVEQNPIKAGLVDEAWGWAWSSAAHHVGEKDIFGFLKHAEFLPTCKEWKTILKSVELNPVVNKLEWCTKTGRPFADFSIVKKLEKITGRRLRYRSVGRPRKLKN